MFSKDDEDMLNAKVGDWYVKHPYRCRSNNSVMLLRGQTTREEFAHIIKSTKEFGEPAFIWTDDLDFLYNPCFTNDMRLLTSQGYETFEELCDKEVNIININGDISKGKVWCSGEKEVIQLTLSNDTKIKCTPNHIFMDIDNNEVKAKDLLKVKVKSYINKTNKNTGLFVKLGFLQGDGCLTRVNSIDHLGLEVNIGVNDDDVFPIFDLVKENNKRVYYINGFNDILKNKGFSLNVLPTRITPTSFNIWDNDDKLDFLKGCYSANGSVIKNTRISYKTTCKQFANEIKDNLLEQGITSYITTNKKKIVEFSNGDYECKESYDINISRYKDMVRFYNLIGFIQTYKMNKLVDTLNYKSPYVRSIKPIGIQKVYDFNEPLTNWGIVEDVIVHNCCEIGMKPITSDGRTGFQSCNLTEINGVKSTTKEIFFEQCKFASILGTLQAGYTDFKHMKDATKEIVEKEALIGVGITGMMNNPNILFNEEIQKQGADIVKYWNKKVANMININQASRTTTIKPSGNSAVILECSSGIHGEHSLRYLRHVQFNKQTEVAQLFMDKNPNMCEESIYNIDQDIVVAFPIEPKETSIFKKDLLGIKQLEYVKLTQQNWIEQGTNKELCIDNRLRHNVSNTITVDDWDEVEKYIFDNQNYLCGVSLLSSVGDKMYCQAPFTEISYAKDIIEKYGEVALFTSALIETGLDAFDGNLWGALDTCLERGEKLKDGSRYLLKRDFVRRFKKFSENFSSEEDCATCLKEIYSMHKYWKIEKTINDIDWIKELAKKEFVDVDTMGATGCAGGKCEL